MAHQTLPPHEIVKLTAEGYLLRWFDHRTRERQIYAPTAKEAFGLFVEASRKTPKGILGGEEAL